MALPQSVREQEERADELWRQNHPPEDETQNPETEAGDTPSQDPGPALEGEFQAPEGKENSAEYWQQRFNVLQGKYNSEIRQLSEANRDLKARDERNDTRLAELESALANAKNAAPVNLSDQFSPEQIEHYGADTLQLVHSTAQRIADEQTRALRDELRGEMQGNFEQVRQQTQSEKQARFWETLNNAVPDWETVNESPAFHDWLSQTVPVHTENGMQQRSRQSLLAGYQEAGNARAVVDLFQQFAKANKGGHDTRELPKRSAGGQDPGSPNESWVSRDEIRDFYQRENQWARRDPKACRARKEQIERAVAAGRVRD